MRRGSTPTHVFDVDMDLRDATVFITYNQSGHNVLEKTGNDIAITESSLTCHLSQEDTLKFSNSPVRIQVRYVKPDGTADASDVIRVGVEEILKDGVITYESEG